MNYSFLPCAYGKKEHFCLQIYLSLPPSFHPLNPLLEGIKFVKDHGEMKESENLIF